MSKTSLILLTIAFLVVGVLLYVMYGYQVHSVLPKLSQPQQEKKQNSQTTVSLVPIPSSILPGQYVTVAIKIQPTGEVPELMQFEIGYDPSMLTYTTISPGKYFKNPDIPLSTILPSTGRISYALTCPEKNVACIDNKVDTVATITFSVNQLAAKAQTTVSFFPKTRFQTKTKTSIILKTENAQINIRGSLPQATTSATVAN